MGNNFPHLSLVLYCVSFAWWLYTMLLFDMQFRLGQENCMFFPLLFPLFGRVTNNLCVSETKQTRKLQKTPGQYLCVFKKENFLWVLNSIPNQCTHFVCLYAQKFNNFIFPFSFFIFFPFFLIASDILKIDPVLKMENDLLWCPMLAAKYFIVCKWNKY